MHTPTVFEIAIGMVPGIGNQLTKILISYCGSAEAIFKTPKGKLLKIPGIGLKTAHAIIKQDVLKQAELELKNSIKENYKITFYTNPEYPERLRHFSDSPTLLFHKGNINYNAEKTIGIVGTRNATIYGKEITEQIIQQLKPYNATIISGLAYGIDIHAHKMALEENLPTWGVMASGINIIYPHLHKPTVKKMLEFGGIITEYYYDTKPDPSYFPSRNRIVAGLCDALIVVEAAKKGGALITAEIGNAYNREVFAVPGNIGNTYNEGCNHLIKTHKAHIYTSINDIEYILNWDIAQEKKSNQKIKNLIGAELAIANVLEKYDSCSLDEISWKTAIPLGKLSSLLLQMEFSGLLKALPGKRFKLS